jgi:hypothetical protein
MPFTPAHPAIVLPLIRSRYFSATGLIIGSLSPDFEYFFKMSVDSIYSHSKVGLFYFDLPVTIVLALLFQSRGQSFALSGVSGAGALLPEWSPDLLM